MVRNVSKNRLVTTWTSFISTFAFFFLLGFFLWRDPETLIPWWCWLIIAFPLVEAIRATLQYMAGEKTRVCPNCHRKTPINNQFCHQCGHDLRAVSYQHYGKVESSEPEIVVNEEVPKPSKPYCNTCGGPLDGSEQYCPICGAPLKQ